ncbi:MAG: insulinase family protein [Deltaproteobacteria bacterium]|nr:MAG: insulinase family protein [Deltaproteobacteria bacterium]
MTTVPLHDAARARIARLNEGADERSRLALVDAWEDGARIERYRLGNGLTVIVWEDHTAPVFAYQTWFKVGSRHDVPGRTGIAHLFEHMMFKATSNHPEGEFDTLMEARGAQTNAATWVDWTYYREKLPSGHLELVVSLEADRMENLVLNHDQLESEREVVKNERLMRVDNDPEGRLYEELYARAFEVHSYGWPTIGWMEDITAITLEDCERFYRRHYAPNNAVVVVVGDVDPDEVLSLVQRYYGHLAHQDVPAETVRVEPEQTAEKRAELNLPLAAPKALYAWHAPAVTDPAYPALEVLNEILAGGDSARLYKALVTDLELCTEVSAWTAGGAQPGLYEIGLTLHPGGDVAVAEREMDRILAEVASAPVTEREIHKAINGIEAGFLRGTADTGTRARRLGNAEVTSGDYRVYWHHQAALRRVTPADVQAVAERVLRPINRTVMIGVPAGPVEAAEPEA